MTATLVNMDDQTIDDQTMDDQKVQFVITNINSMYIDAAIKEMNEETNATIQNLSKHIEKLQNFVDQLILLKNVYSQDELVNFISTVPKLDGWPVIVVPQMTLIPDKQESTKVAVDEEKLLQQMQASMKSEIPEAACLVYIDPPVTGFAYDLPDIQQAITSGAKSLENVENCQIRNIFNCGLWLHYGRQQYKCAKRNGKLLSGTSNKFTDWLEEHCKLKKTRAYDYMNFTEQFYSFPCVLKCRLPFSWFVKNGKRVSTYLTSHSDIGQKWAT